MARSLRSTLVLASVLWTAGLLMLMHMISMMVLHFFPVVRGRHSAMAVLVSLFMMGWGVFVLRRGLTPFRLLRERLTSVRAGKEQRIEGQYANEVQPLIDELNGLLEDREKAVRRAVATAGDLAHGLKTPLALLAQEADRANEGVGEAIMQQVERMSRQMNYHLARARAAASGASGAARCDVPPCADALVRTLTKLYAGRSLQISTSIAPDACVRVNREDLDEILGNLLDNACKWGRSKVVMRSAVGGEMIVITVDDDGPGLVQELRTAVLERGVRADEAAPGSGLGLAIVRDLSELYGGSIALGDSPLGGLRASVKLPAC